MQTRRWINHSLPQTLGNAVILLYLNAGLAAFSVLFGGFFHPLSVAVIGAEAAAGYGIANEKRWGYRLGVGMAVSPFVLRFAFGGVDAVLGSNIINLMFEILLVALLLHRDSKEHQRIWFS